MGPKIKTFDCIVIGGGCIGCATAMRLADSGASVGLLELGKLNSFSSAAAVGGLNYLSDDLAGSSLLEFTSRCADEFKDFLVGLTERTGQGIDYFEDDLLQVAFSGAEMEKLDQGLGRLHSDAKVSDRFARLSGSELLELAPYLSRDVIGGYRLSEPQVEVPNLLLALTKAVKTHPRIEVFEGFEVRKLDDLGAFVDVQGTNSSQSRMRAKTVVVAAGVLSPKILGLEELISMKPVKGQAFRLAGGEALEKYQGRPFPFHVYSHPENDKDDFGRIYGSYIVPRRNGEVVSGVTYEENSGFDTSVHAEVEQRMMSINERVVPALAEMHVVGRWSGLRPLMTSCGSRKEEELCLPIVGRISPRSNVILATGHLGLGITMSDGTAKLIERLLLNENDAADLRALQAMHPRFDAEEHGGLRR